MLLILSACQGKQDIIEAAYIEFGSANDRENRELHFIVQINEYKMKKNTSYQVQFLIEDSPYIQQLTGVEQFEIPDTYTSNEGTLLVTGTSVAPEDLSTINVDTLRKHIEDDKEVKVNVYSNNKILASESVTEYKQFVNQHVNPDIVSELEVIDVNKNNGEVIFEKAITEAKKDENTTVMKAQPTYIFTLQKESYLLWENLEYFVKGSDPFTLYMIPQPASNEIYSYMELE